MQSQVLDIFFLLLSNKNDIGKEIKFVQQSQETACYRVFLFFLTELGANEQTYPIYMYTICIRMYLFCIFLYKFDPAYQ